MGWLDKYKEGGWLDGLTNKGFNYNGAWGGQFQYGGDVEREETFSVPVSSYESMMRAMMKSKMASQAALGNPSARRMFFGPENDRPYNWTGEELDREGNPVGVPRGDTGTHFMSSMGNYAVPEIQEREGELQYLPDASPRDREAIPFDRESDARYFSEHYKDVAPAFQYMEGLDKYESGGSVPGSVGFTYARTGAPSNGKYAKKTMASAKTGRVIKDNMGQWAHPGEITEIDGTDITMQGVPYPVLGISDIGDIKLMKPNKNYKFKGNKVTELPLSKDGSQLVKLDQLTNFTNYNTPQPGGWLDKY